MSPDELSIIIPARGRRDVLERTLDGLVNQTVSGFEVVVVIDGDDEPSLDEQPGRRVVRQSKAGPGGARNAGVAVSSGRLILFLGADMVPDPDLVERHLDAHGSDDRVAVLGRVRWHDEVAAGPLHRWMDWSATQFDFEALDRAAANGECDAGFGRFYSCNVSLHRSLFDEVGGFDPAFTFYYEDLDIGWRLGQAGLQLHYRPDAVVRHVHHYEWDDVVRRFEGIARGERFMAEKHDWFHGFYRQRILEADASPPASSVWVPIADRVSWGPVRDLANRYLHQRLAEPFLAAWDDGRDLAELQEYLGADFDRAMLVNHVSAVEDEEEAAGDESTFYRTSQAYLYDLTVFAMSPTKLPYHRVVRRLVPPGARLLDYGCGIGADGLRFIEQGYRVDFADFDNPSTEYLAWRLRDRGLSAAIHDVDGEVPGGYDLVYCFDVIEHLDDPVAHLERLESLADIVVVNFLAPTPHDTHVHKDLDIPALLRRCADLGLRHYRIHHGRSHLVAYSTRPRPAGTIRSLAWRRAGDLPRVGATLEHADVLAARLRSWRPGADPS